MKLTEKSDLWGGPIVLKGFLSRLLILLRVRRHNRPSDCARANVEGPNLRIIACQSHRAFLTIALHLQ